MLSGSFFPLNPLKVRHFSRAIRKRAAPSSEENSEAALLHPSCLHVALSARRLGGVDWAAVRRVAEAGDALEAKAAANESATIGFSRARLPTLFFSGHGTPRYIYIYFSEMGPLDE